MRNLLALVLLGALACVAWAAPDDPCLVCGGDARPVVVKGRTVPLCAHDYCQDLLAREPDKYLAQVMPRAALFHEDTATQRGSWTVFALGTGALAACLLIALVGHRRLVAAAPRHAIPPGLGRIPSTPQPAHCPACNSENHPSAEACGRCGAALSPASACEARRALLTEGDRA